MKLQPESKKELLRIACGTAICTAAMWVLFAALHLVGWVRFDYTVVLGGLVGAAVAIANFAGICFVVQKIIDEQDEKRRKAKLQLSHNSRMLLQAVWVIVAIVVGGGFGGVLGMFLGVPIFACISSLVNWFTNRSLTKKGVTDDAMFAPAPLASPDEKKD